MYCVQCGQELPAEANFCGKCGTDVRNEKKTIYVLRISGSPIEVYVETNSESAIELCRLLHHKHNLTYEIVGTPEQAGRRWKPGLACFYVKGNELDILNLKESITIQLLISGWKMQPATSLFVLEE